MCWDFEIGVVGEKLSIAYAACLWTVFAAMSDMVDWARYRFSYFTVVTVYLILIYPP